jgi:hypothetical protein
MAGSGNTLYRGGGGSSTPMGPQPGPSQYPSPCLEMIENGRRDNFKYSVKGENLKWQNVFPIILWFSTGCFLLGKHSYYLKMSTQAVSNLCLLRCAVRPVCMFAFLYVTNFFVFLFFLRQGLAI